MTLIISRYFQIPPHLPSRYYTLYTSSTPISAVCVPKSALNKKSPLLNTSHLPLTFYNDAQILSHTQHLPRSAISHTLSGITFTAYSVYSQRFASHSRDDVLRPRHALSLVCRLMAGVWHNGYHSWGAFRR